MRQKMSVGVPIMQFVIAACLTLCIGVALYSHEYTALQLWLQGATLVLALLNGFLTLGRYRTDRDDNEEESAEEDREE